MQRKHTQSAPPRAPSLAEFAESLVQTKWVADYLVRAWIRALDTIIRVHLSTALSCLLSFRIDTLTGFVWPIAVSVGMWHTSGFICSHLSVYDSSHRRAIARIAGAARDFAYWRRIALVAAGMYAIAVCALFELSSRTFIIGIIQALISFFACEAIEHGFVRRLARAARLWLEPRPDATKFAGFGEAIAGQKERFGAADAADSYVMLPEAPLTQKNT